jgi:N-carbamoylputrescine amidase
MQEREAFTLALIQMTCGPDPQENLSRACRRAEEAAGEGARLVCLPELFRSQYFCQRQDGALFDTAEPVPGPTTRALAEVARARGVVIVAPLFERRAPGLYHNSAAVFDADGTMLGVYRKMHLPDDPGYHEKFYFAPGDLGFRVFSTRVGRIAVLICWDQWYPEASRLAALRGASVILYPTAIGWHPHEKEAERAAQHDAWRTVQRGHAVSNGVYVAAVNRTGRERAPGAGAGIEFWGRSFVADPFGIVVAEASAEGESTVFARVDLGRIEAVRRQWPFLRDRRTDAYGGIESRYLGDETWDGCA